MRTAVALAFAFVFVFGVAGFLWWLIDGAILSEMWFIAEDSTLLTYAQFMWRGSLVAIIVFSIYWFIRKLKEWQHISGGIS